MRAHVFQVAIAVVLIALGTEALFYLDSDRHATILELGIATMFGLVYFSLLEVMIAKRFIVKSPDSWLCLWLRVQGFGVFKVMEKLNDPASSWTITAERFLLGLIGSGLVAAGIDAYIEHRRREKKPS
jgi:hypothetical protein